MSFEDADLIARDTAEMLYGVALDSLDVAHLDNLLSVLLRSAFLVGKRFDALFYEQLEDGIEQVEAFLAQAASGAPEVITSDKLPETRRGADGAPGEVQR